MKAALRTQYGPPEVLEVKETEQPVPGENDVLVRVRAATVNRTDCVILTGKPAIMKLFTGLRKPKLKITGTDFAGEVVEIGKNVTRFSIGDNVWGFNDLGLSTHAEYLTIGEEKEITKMSDTFTFEQAAASAEVAHYAYNTISKITLNAGQKVLINGATGGIGSALVQFCKLYGLNITAVCEEKHADKIKALGADKIIDFTREDFTKENEQYDFVLDAVGKSTFGKCKAILKPNGIYISSELGPWSQNPFFALLGIFSRGKKVIFPVPFDIKRSLKFINELIEQDKFSPLIDRSWPLDEIADAYRYVASGQKIGNVIIRM